MTFQSRTHIITQDELKAVENMGVQFLGFDKDPLVFLNQFFSNFEPLIFFTDLLSVFLPISVNIIYKQIRYNKLNTVLELVVASANYNDEKNGIAFSRSIFQEKGEMVVSHDFFRLPSAHRGQGIAKQVLLVCLQQYLNLGVKKIKVHAALDGGGYAWARYGFGVTNKKEVDKILEQAKQLLQPDQFKQVLKIYDHYYVQHPNGETFPVIDWSEMSFMKSILRGSEWNGTLDLNNQEQFHILRTSAGLALLKRSFYL